MVIDTGRLSVSMEFWRTDAKEETVFLPGVGFFRIIIGS
jgi:hypothetical protein